MKRLSLPLRKTSRHRARVRLSEAPLRAELLTAAQMAERGHELAAEHEWRRPRRGDTLLLERLRRNEALIEDTCRALAAAIADGHRITPAGEWLLDHLYVIHEQVRKTRAHLPRGYSAELPVLTRGASAGMPRVYDLALDAISHGDGRVDQDALARFVHAYQERTPLSLGELWAIPIMLRVALIENLGRAAARVRRGLAHSRLAAQWAQRMLDVAQRDPKSLILVVADMARSEPPLTQAFVAEMTRQLHGAGAALNLPLSWIEQRLAETGLSIAQLVQTSHHERALDRVTIDNSIASLRLLDALDWHEFVETTSAVDRVLAQDPIGVYTNMDFATRDSYRHAVERYARRSGSSEPDVAATALELARAAAAQSPAPGLESAAHIGYHLLGAGRAQLLRRCGAGAIAARIETWRSGSLPFSVYLSAVVALGLLAAVPLLRPLWTAQLPLWLRLVATFCGVVALSHPAVWLIDRLALALVAPRPLPRMDLRKGIPRDARTLVVVPCLLGGIEEARTLADQLELRYLANRGGGLGFALLSDFPDAAEAELAGDAAILDAAAEAIHALNRRHPKTHFLLLQRPRVWSDSEQCWMGRERKRGKLADLNALLRTGDATAFSRVVGFDKPAAEGGQPMSLARAAGEGGTIGSADGGVGEALEWLRGVRFVITLDADTHLPSDAARRLVETMAHPLNRPRFAADGRRVESGYAILQPRVGNLLPPASSTRYAALFGGDAGLDPYTQAVSNLYQDLFAEGSFIGKGIYDVEAFERALGDGTTQAAAGRFPDHRILSHDLLEGCYARAGLTADIELYEEYPQSYRLDAPRRARWIRGDWQIAAWLFPSVPMAQGRRERNPLSWLSRWKIFDNLRRSVLAPALFALLLLAWFALPQPVRWSALVLGSVLLPVVVDAAIAALRMQGAGFARHVGGVLRGFGAAAARVLFRLVCLPFEAIQNADMIARTAWRVHVSKRHLLQWVASSVVAQCARGDASSAWLAFRMAPVAALVIAAALLLSRAEVFALAAPWLLAWFFAPAVIAWTARAPVRKTQPLAGQQARFVGQAARRTWAWFERFVSAEDNWLPPDHYQEYPALKIMHRTSSTNIGMGLLANLAAHDLGYVSLRGLLAATRRTFDTLRKLERHRGHIYNWYDTQTLEPLQPMYVSTVDSGNFVGHVLTLRQGLFECLCAPIVGAPAFAGFEDTFAVLRSLSECDAEDGLWRAFADALAAARRLPPSLPIALTRDALRELFLRAQALQAALAQGEPLEREWSEKLLRQAAMAVADLEDFVGDVSLRAAVAHDVDAIHAESPMPSLAALAASASTTPAARELARTCVAEIEALGALCADFARVDWQFLYDPAREQFAIGYNVREGRRDAGYYDLLASEARLAVYLAVAQGQIAQDGWFALGRVQTRVDEGQVLLSWSGSMFEYLMPQLVMPTWPGSLIDESARVAVARQIAWGREHGLPWGISESGYFLTDAGQNYHYRAFGVPGLGLQRGLSQDRVIAPYASALAMLVAPAPAANNLVDLAARGWWSQYGYYEAIDFTAAHLPANETVGVVREYMAHHQGMALVAFDECLNGALMQRRFAADAELAAVLLLLQERVPRDVPLAPAAPPALDVRAEEEAAPAPQRRYVQADTPRPAVQLLSNGSYHLMLTQSGAGYSRWRELDLTRWREDPTRDAWGTFVHIRDVDGGKVWSTCAAVAADAAEACEIVFDDARVEQRLTLDKLEARVQIVVSPEDDVELRRLRLTNRARAARTLELTSYAEVVLNAGAADALHPAFNNLFVQTEILHAHPAILATRRPRLAGDMQPWLVHLFCMREESGHANAPAQTSFETDRARFLGRGNGAHAAAALRRAGALSNTAGDVLDPVVAIRQRISVPAEGSVVFDLVTGAGADREAVLALADKYRDRAFADRALAIATTHNRMALGQINVSESEAQLYSRLASAMLYADPARRAPAEVGASNRLSQNSLWAHGISGDLPIALVLVEDVDKLALVRAAVAAQRYCAIKGLRFDLVVLNEERGGYRQEVNDAIYSAVTAAGEGAAIDRPGGVFIRSSAQIPHEDRVQLLAVARVVLSDRAGGFAEQLKEAKAAANEIAVPKLNATRRNAGTDARQVSIPKLAMFNGHGGFARDGREYVVVCDALRRTPLPWANVLANPQFGSVVTESGGGYTFFDNAHEYRLTPWSNDAVADASGEAFYLRDEETGAFWSPTPLPAGGRGRYLARHGFGYTQFEHVEDGIASELRVHVDGEAPVKFFVLRLRNDSGRARRLSVTGYVEWVLGDLPARTAQHVTSWLDGSGALLARNTWNAEFAGHVAFFDAEHAQRTLTCDRSEFIGRNGSLDSPAAMRRTNLSGRVGAGLDPCAAIQVPLELADGETREVIFRLGAARGAEEVEALVARLRRSGSARASFEAVVARWQRLLGNVVVTAPDAGFNLLANGWLAYQTIACRLWARSGFHQSGGAFGFRDQLQDAMALVHVEPALLREQIVLAAQRQFREGDVQHWWHPPGGRGVRTNCSDDYLWLPLAVARYVRASGDAAVLDERSHYLEGRPLNPGEESYYDLPLRSNETADLYQHCVRAIEHALHGMTGTAHELPRIGSGDWNDGMNAVGAAGRGESVWLGFFLHHVLMRFRDVAALRGDDVFAAHCERHARQLQASLERHAWDGDWYRRAWFDDGTPLGSKDDAQCRIDSIAQSWAVLSGAGDPARAQRALDALDAQLVDEDAGLIRLLHPPFDRSAASAHDAMPDPGYIAGYLPGVRENGGQYTHAAVWAAMAFAEAGRVERAWQLFELINPLRHAGDEKSTEIYKGEPYVVAGDVYANPAHRGRAGWTWYTGSAGWMYRLLIETFLGLAREGAHLRIAPRLPAAWSGIDIAYRHGDGTYAIHVQRDASRPPGTVVLDGVVQAGDAIVLDAAAGVHRVEVHLAVAVAVPEADADADAAMAKVQYSEKPIGT